MHFNVRSLSSPSTYIRSDQHQVEGPLNKGVVRLHMIRRPSQHDFQYKYLAVDVEGHPRIYLENTNASSISVGKSKTKLFGVQWTK